MSLYEGAVKKPIMTSLCFLAVVIFGLFSLSKLPIDLYPDIDTNTIMVMTAYPGASASDIENNVTRPLENTLNAVSNLKHITSRSSENMSLITLEFEFGNDIDVLTNDVRDKLDMVSSQLIDSFGVGERLITSRSEPVFGGVYKLVAIEDDEGNIIPKIKISENAAKITTPHFKKVYRIFSRDTGKAEADLICLRDEEIDFTQPLELFDPSATWKRKVYTNIEAKELLVPIFLNGKRVYEVPELQVSRAYCQRQVDALWDEVKRFENPHNYYVDLSQKLWDIKQSLLNSHDMN